MTRNSPTLETLPVREIVAFWFDGCQSDAGRLPQRSRFWFVEGRRHDEAIRQRFGRWIEPLAAAPLEVLTAPPEALAPPHVCLAAILVLDQFSRHCYRGQARAFACDAQALALLQKALDLGIDRELHPVEAVFFYMPLQHAEDLAAHDRAGRLYRQLVQAAARDYKELLQGSLDSALEHRELIQRFGRFPHRNEVMGRQSTAEETAYLNSGGKRFGQ